MMSFSHLEPVNPAQAGQFTTARVTEESKLQKKIQNRVYKRASRLRNGMNKRSSRTQHAQHQHHVNRWRLDEALNIANAHDTSELTPTQDISGPIWADEKSSRVVPEDILKDSSTAIWFPLPADHLLHLVEYNVFRGLMQNKGLVNSMTVQCCAPGPQIDTSSSFPIHSTILPVAPHYSGSLSPTPIQMSVNHFSWIDCLPCPTMRENLIRREFDFSHADFVKDLVGYLINLDIFKESPSFSGSSLTYDTDEVGCSAGRGLVNWGEPYLVSSWEVTPGFLQKWGWAVVNCQELIDSTNHWRISRGETPLLLPSTQE